MRSLYPAICAHDVAASRDFYVDLLGFKVVFDSGWYVQLVDARKPAVQLGIVEREHPSVPAGYRSNASGVLISVEVTDATEIYQNARQAGLQIAQPLREEDFGQRHFMTVDPDHLLVDVIELIPMSGEFAAL